MIHVYSTQDTLQNVRRLRVIRGDLGHIHRITMT